MIFAEQPLQDFEVQIIYTPTLAPVRIIPKLSLAFKSRTTVFVRKPSRIRQKGNPNTSPKNRISNGH